jgi:hypothetical protein
MQSTALLSLSFSQTAAACCTCLAAVAYFEMQIVLSLPVIIQHKFLDAAHQPFF